MSMNYDSHDRSFPDVIGESRFFNPESFWDWIVRSSRTMTDSDFMGRHYIEKYRKNMLYLLYRQLLMYSKRSEQADSLFNLKTPAIYDDISPRQFVIPACPESFRKRGIPDALRLRE